MTKPTTLPKQVLTATTFLREVRRELSQVIWPTREKTIKLTAIVVGVSIFIAAYIGLLDLGFTKLIDTIIIR